MQADFLSFHFTGIAGDEAGAAQRRAQVFIVFDQGAGDAVANGAGLAGDAATADADIDVEVVFHVHGFQWLAYDHAAGFTAEESVQAAVVDGDGAIAFLEVDTGRGGLAAAGAVMNLFCHGLDFQNLRLLGTVLVFGPGINPQTAEHLPAQRALGQHAFDGGFNDFFGLFCNEFFKGG